jgi:hypothetical protein
MMNSMAKIQFFLTEEKKDLTGGLFYPKEVLATVSGIIIINKKNPAITGRVHYSVFILCRKLLRMNCLNRTNVSTCATIGAGIRINFIDIALRNCFYRTLINAGTTCGTIVCNYVCHFN